MKEVFKNHSLSLNQALLSSLVNRIPPSVFSSHLEDLVNILMEALSRGEVVVTFSKSNPPENLICSGWPEDHWVG